MKRPTMVILVAYTLGILWGYIFKISIVPLWIIFLILYYFLSKINFPFKKLIKVLLNKKIIIILFLFSIISNTITIIYNNKYDNLFNDLEEVEVIGTIVSNKEETEYKEKYKINVIAVNNNTKYKNTNLVLYINKGINLEYGDKVKISGEYKVPNVSRNDKGYNQKEYFKTEKIYGTLNGKKIEMIQKEAKKDLLYFSNKVKQVIKQKINDILSEEKAKLLLGILLGETSEISDENINYFRDSNLYHLLAVSGAHVGNISIGILYLLGKLKIHKKKSKLICIVFLIFFMALVGFTPSVTRACIMIILIQFAFVVERKTDFICNISFSALIILLENPFSLFNIGFQLSFLRSNWDSIFLSYI